MKIPRNKDVFAKPITKDLLLEACNKLGDALLILANNDNDIKWHLFDSAVYLHSNIIEQIENFENLNKKKKKKKSSTKGKIKK
jgi:hypothetical protein